MHVLSALQRTAREQFTLRHLLGVAVVFGVLAFVVELSRELLVGFAAALVVSEVVALLRDTPEIDQRYVRAGIGLAVVAGSLAMGYGALTGESVALWLPTGLVVFGVWLVVDAAAALYRGSVPDAGTGREEELSSAEVMLLMSHAHLVSDELEDGPRTVPELAAACDLTESRVEETLEHLVDSGVVSAESGPGGRERYVLHEERTGVVAFLRQLLFGAVALATRPFRAAR